MMKLAIFTFSFLYFVCSAMSATDCAVCNANPGVQASITMCWQDQGKWCNCSTLTPQDSCGACYNIGGQDPNASCTDGLCCTGDEAPCIGPNGGICYGIYSTCICIDGVLNCNDAEESIKINS